VEGWRGWARSQLSIVCWKRSPLPQVCGVVGSGVLLADVEASELGLEAVAPAIAAGEACGEDHAFVGEGGGGDTEPVNGIAEGVATTLGPVMRGRAVGELWGAESAARRPPRLPAGSVRRGG